MSMAQPFQPNLHPDRHGVPAADLGPGAPEPAPGFGIGGEEGGGLSAGTPDRAAAAQSTEESSPDEASTLEDAPEGFGEPNVFRPPRPDEVGTDAAES